MQRTQIQSDGKEGTILRHLKKLSPCDLFLDSFGVGLCKKVQHGAAEVVSVAVWVPQLICNCIQEEIPA
jgi:sarcosine oxidase gamma subunit